MHTTVVIGAFQELWNTGLDLVQALTCSSTRKALDLEASKDLVFKFKAQDVVRSKYYPLFLYHGVLMEF